MIITPQTEIDKCPLSKITINSLIVFDIFTIQDLLELTEKDLSSIPGIGPKSITQINYFLSKNNLSLKKNRRKKC